MNCIACERIQQIWGGSNPYFIKELSESYVVAADNQRYEGYCILLLKTHAEHLSSLEKDRQLRLFEDLMLVANAIGEAFNSRRINYECLGNTMSHVHWHVIPRYDWDPQPQSPIWVRPKEERNIGVGEEQLKEIVTRLVNVLNSLSTSRRQI